MGGGGGGGGGGGEGRECFEPSLGTRPYMRSVSYMVWSPDYFEPDTRESPADMVTASFWPDTKVR